MSRFEDVTQEVDDFVKKVRKEYFGELASANIKVLYDTKKRTSGGKIVLGRMQKTNDLLRHLTVDDANDTEGYDYIMYLCKAAFDNVDDEDKVRLIRHELQHCDVDMDANSNPYKLRGHELEDFYDEIELNRDDARWAERCVDVALSMYDMEENAH
jgi:predicted metallopeptidase